MNKGLSEFMYSQLDELEELFKKSMSSIPPAQMSLLISAAARF